MLTDSSHRSWLILWIGTVVSVLEAVPALAQLPEPHLGWVFPAGGQRGTRVEVTIGGTNLEGATEVHISGTGVTASITRLDRLADDKAKKTKSAESDQGEAQWLAHLTVTLATDADIGQRDLRLVTPNGISNRCRFIVGQIQEVEEVEANSTIEKAQRLPDLPVLVNGRILQGDQDFFRFAAKAGQTLVCQAQARALLPYLADAVPGWVQSDLTLYNANGLELAYVDDFRFDPDPLLVYRVEQDGDYVLQIKDTLYRGREDFVYRLSIGELPFITHIFPLGGQTGAEVQVQLYGANLDRHEVDLKLGPEPGLQKVQIQSKGLESNALPFAMDDGPEVYEREQNDLAGTANPVDLPVIINGRIERPGDVDYFVFWGQKAQRVVLEVIARRLGSPLDSVLALLNARGASLAENDDTVDEGAGLVTHQADSYLQQVLPADGRYLVRIRDNLGQGGEEYAYRLRIGPPRPGFDLFVAPDHLLVGQGGTTVVTVHAVRRDGFKGEIRLSVADLPSGLTACPAIIPPDLDRARFTITASPDATTGILSPGIWGAASGDQGRTVTHKALPAEELMQAFSYTHLVPTGEFALTVGSPVVVQLIPDCVPGKVLEIAQGGTIEIKVAARRSEPAKGPISIGADLPPKGVTVKRVSIPKDQNDVQVTITAGPQAPVGAYQNLILAGTFKIGKQNLKAFAPAIPIQVVQARP